MFPSILNRFYSTDGMRAITRRKIVWKYTLIYTLHVIRTLCTKRRENIFSHVSIIDFHSFFVVAENLCKWMHTMTQHRKELFHENCRKCGTRIKCINPKNAKRRIICNCQWPYFKNIETFYRRMSKGKLFAIAMAIGNAIKWE